MSGKSPIVVTDTVGQAEWDALNDPASRGHAVHGVRDAKVIADTEVRIRGEAEDKRRDEG